MFLDRKPNFLLRFSREFRCIVFRGPHRTCAARKAGFAEMADWGTRSGAPARVAGGAKAVGRAKAVADREGRRVGREVKVLRSVSGLLTRGLRQGTAGGTRWMAGAYLAERRGVRVGMAGRAVAVARRRRGWRSILFRGRVALVIRGWRDGGRAWWVRDSRVELVRSVRGTDEVDVGREILQESVTLQVAAAVGGMPPATRSALTRQVPSQMPLLQVVNSSVDNSRQ